MSIAIIGGTSDELAIVCKYIEDRYKGINICFKHSSYIDNATEVISALVSANPDALIVGMGTPKQESFILSVEDPLPMCKFYFTCGGFLSQTASSGDYYHPIIKKLGLRWLQRAFLHKHVRERLIKDYPVFYLKYFTSSLLYFLKRKH